ncbi:predicted protein [Chaetomium globosum CBS 148.51]|uniref:2EXR domain-containing protein n=1 Tax=Chaetomium globosum (strain ATCC 6205 / CBS 148.51 / DSM 1962 / NBRC 6347 / NRRL 1970) TaxID=306901 RepID=Q2H2N6_CHAGB|nr:uncharacterized protein CHGG_03960 [Chaetomium globosum CBS 148.51]EAQ87341.1 predicted protein [Chaetomium globosum CBS 148.51]
MTSPTSFTLFPLLPPELRLQIYHHACHPRVTTLSYLPAPRDTYHCSTPPPPLLHISRESRAEGLRLYAKCLLPSPPSPPSPPTQQPPPDLTESPPEDDDPQPRRYFYHHPHLDTLYLPRPPRAADPLGLGYADWAREFAAGAATARTAVVTTTTTTTTAAATRTGPGAGPSGLAGVVRRLAVDYVPAEVRRPWEVFGKVCLIRGCPLLEEAYLVVQVSDGGEGRRQQRLGAAGLPPGGRRAVEFVDPAAGDAEIVRIMERVRASFRVELGDGAGEAGSVGSAAWGGLGKEGAEEGTGRGGLELVPKAMVLSPWGCRHVACAS